MPLPELQRPRQAFPKGLVAACPGVDLNALRLGFPITEARHVAV